MQGDVTSRRSQRPRGADSRIQIGFCFVLRPDDLWYCSRGLQQSSLVNVQPTSVLDIAYLDPIVRQQK